MGQTVYVRIYWYIVHISKKNLYFKERTAGERRAICFVEKVGIEPRTLGYQALLSANCATSRYYPVVCALYIMQ